MIKYIQEILRGGKAYNVLITNIFDCRATCLHLVKSTHYLSCSFKLQLPPCNCYNIESSSELWSCHLLKGLKTNWKSSLIYHKNGTKEFNSIKFVGIVNL